MEEKVGLGLVKRDKHVTVEELQQLFPKKKNTINEKTVDIINSTIDDPNFNGYSLVQTLTDYQGVMQTNSGNMNEYIQAVRFCAFLESEGDSAVKAYTKTFCHRDFVKARIGVSFDSTEYKELTSAASRYRRSPMVRDILTQADLPFYLLFRGQSYKAVDVLSKVMITATLDRDKINAAKALLDAVKAPENRQVELNIGPSKEAQDMQTMLFAQMAKIAEGQHHELSLGRSIDSVQQIGLTTEFTEAEVED